MSGALLLEGGGYLLQEDGASHLLLDPATTIVSGGGGTGGSIATFTRKRFDELKETLAAEKAAAIKAETEKLSPAPPPLTLDSLYAKIEARIEALRPGAPATPTLPAAPVAVPAASPTAPVDHAEIHAKLDALHAKFDAILSAIDQAAARRAAKQAQIDDGDIEALLLS